MRPKSDKKKLTISEEKFEIIWSLSASANGKRNWSTFNKGIDHFIRNDLDSISKDLYEQYGKVKFSDEPHTLARAFGMKKPGYVPLSNHIHLEALLDCYITKLQNEPFGTHGHVKQNSPLPNTDKTENNALKSRNEDGSTTGQFTSQEQGLALVEKLVEAIVHRYKNDPEFNFIKIIASSGNSVKALSLADYYIQLSCVMGEDIRNRDSLINREYCVNQTTAGIRNFIPNDYISDTMMADNDRVFIVGNPGVGKSTFARWYCNKWVNKIEMSNVIPIYIILRDLNFTVNDPLARYISDAYLASDDASPADIRHAIRFFKEKFCLLLDGFDELSTDKQRALKKSMDTICQNTGKYILLTRPYGLLGAAGWDNNITVNIDGFSANNIENYISSILNIAGKKGKKKKELLKIISGNKVLADFAHIPLMLSFIVYIYLVSQENDSILQNIESRYDLQKEVINWMHIYEDTKQDLNLDYQLFIAEIGKIAYELQINNEFKIKVAPEHEQSLKSFCEIGIGSIVKTDDQRAYFSFASITFQEYFAAENIVGSITKEGFLYLCKYKVFWNFAQMLIGAISNAGNEQLINSILDELSRSPNDRKMLLHMLLLAETNAGYIRATQTPLSVSELYTAYLLHSYNHNYHEILPVSLAHVYQKLNSSQQNTFKGRILQEFVTFGKNAIKDNDFVKNLDFPVILLIPSLSLVNDDFFCRRILTQIISFMKETSNIDPVDSDMILSQYLELLNQFNKGLFKTAQNKELARKIFTNRVKKKYWGVYTRLQIDDTNALLALQNLKAIFQPAKDAKEKDLIECVENIAACIYHTGTDFAQLEELYQQEFIELLTDNFDDILDLFTNAAITDNQENPRMNDETIAGLIIDGLNGTGNAVFYKQITDIIDLVSSFAFYIEIKNNDAFMTYVQDDILGQLLISFDTHLFSKLLSLVACTSNIKYHFAKIREKLFDVMYNYIQKNAAIFQSVSSYSEEEIDATTDDVFVITSEMDKLLEMVQKTESIYEFDRKYILDQLMFRYPEISNYKYFKENMIPRLLEVDTELYQQKYWSFVDSYMNDITQYKFLVGIMLNEKIYHYESNLKFLQQFFRYTLVNIGNKERVHPHLNNILEICGKTLMLIKKTGKNSYKPLIDCIGDILLLKRVKKIVLTKKEYILLNIDALCAYILQYHFTFDIEYDLNIDYYSMAIAMPYKRGILDNIIKVFTTQNVLNMREINEIAHVLGSSLMERIENYLAYDESLQVQFDKHTFKSLNLG